MAEFAIAVDIAAPPDRVWSVISDVERWPEWTPSVRSIKRYDTGPLAVGSRARIEQPKLRPADWQVTRLEPGRGFDWETRIPGLAITGRHWVEPAAIGSRATVAIQLSGVLSPIVVWFARTLNATYLELEAKGLKARSESLDATRIDDPR